MPCIEQAALSWCFALQEDLSLILQGKPTRVDAVAKGGTNEQEHTLRRDRSRLSL